MIEGRVAILTGGSTPERNVALAGAGQVLVALRKKGWQVRVFDTCLGEIPAAEESTRLAAELATRLPSIEELSELQAKEDLLELVRAPGLRDSDLVMPVLHGRQGEGGQVQNLLELAGLPFVGSGSIGSTLAMDKDVSKRLFRDASIPTPGWLVWKRGLNVDSLGLPLVVKPSRVGSTVGLTIVEDLKELPVAVDQALLYDDVVLVERFIEGRELTVGVLDGEALAVGEIRPQHAIFDYECKYTPGMCEEIFPAPISSQLSEELRTLALRVHETLQLRDFSRSDFRIDPQGGIWCLEANTLPGMTRTSLLPQSAAAAGVPFVELCDRLCRLALARGRSADEGAGRRDSK